MGKSGDIIMSRNQQIILASGNPGKIKEIQSILNEFRVVPQSMFNIGDVEETGTTFIENAIIKARHTARVTDSATIADDSGLVVDELKGAPGVISARYAGSGATDRENLQKLLEAMQGIPEHRRTARFVCVIVYMEHGHDPMPVIAQGTWEGRILETPCGEHGFGYDPVFWVPEFQCSSAQLEPEQKNAISHRGKALKSLTQLMKQR